MSRGWSPNDKAVAKAAVGRARRRAEEEAISRFEQYKVNAIDDLWALELKIREWRKPFSGFGLVYESANARLAEWLAKGWLLESDLARMSPERLDDIKAQAKAGLARKAQ